MRDEYNKETKKRKSLPTPNRKLGSRNTSPKNTSPKNTSPKDTSPKRHES